MSRRLPPRSSDKRPPEPRQLGRPRGSTSEATRARILAAARICFARTGYAATTNKDIADFAGVTAAAIYLYFDSKTALYLAAVRDAHEQLVSHYRRGVADAGSLREGFRALLTISGRLLHERDPSLSAFLSALPVEMQRHAEIAAAIAATPNEVVVLIGEMVEAAVRSGEIARPLAGYVGATFLACAMGFSLYLATVDGAHASQMVDVFGALIEGNLFQPGRAPRRRSRRSR
jgi:AcrR family transcriptional regulator